MCLCILCDVFICVYNTIFIKKREYLFSVASTVLKKTTIAIQNEPG